MPGYLEEKFMSFIVNGMVESYANRVNVMPGCLYDSNLKSQVLFNRIKDNRDLRL